MALYFLAKFRKITVKVAFFQKVRFVYQILKKKSSKKTILNLKFKFPANNSVLKLAGNFKSSLEHLLLFSRLTFRRNDEISTFDICFSIVII